MDVTTLPEGFNVWAASDALEGDIARLAEAFRWNTTPQGFNHWCNIRTGREPFDAESQEYVDACVRLAEANSTSDSLSPPRDLLKRLEEDWFNERENVDVLLVQAWQAGADAELEACCEWLRDDGWSGTLARLRAARRPKPPSLKEQALKQMEVLESHGAAFCNLGVLRRALETLPD
jgi:hypothetical protein